MGQPCGRPAQLLDLYPTLADLCRVPAPKGLEGHSLAPLLDDVRAPWNHAAYSVARRGKLMGRSLRTERYRYTEWGAAGKSVELYDHDADPHELRNLAREPGQAQTLERLQMLLRQGLHGK